MLIGLTGGIGSGKSTIAKELERLGYAVYYSDQEAKRIIVNNPAVRSQIEYLFGSDIYADNVYQSKEVAKQVFSQPELLKKLNAIVHPAVNYDVAHWSRLMEEQHSIKEEDRVYLCFVESALLFSSGLCQHCALTVSVNAPEDVRLLRVMARDKVGKEQVSKRIQSQREEEALLSNADIIVTNDGVMNIEQITKFMLYNIKKSLAEKQENL